MLEQGYRKHLKEQEQPPLETRQQTAVRLLMLLQIDKDRSLLTSMLEQGLKDCREQIEV